MFALFDEAGKFLTGRVMSQTDASLQVELDSGKRVKVKQANVFFTFDKPAPSALGTDATALAQTIDLDLAWEFAPEDDFGFADLAGLYFEDPPTLAQQWAALQALSDAPHYFRKAGKGRYKKASAEVLQQALAALEKKRQQQLLIEQWAADLQAGSCPEPILSQLYKILFKPDKNAPEYKAVATAAHQAQLAPLALLQRAGAIQNPYQFHWQRFLFEHFPKGTGFAAVQAPAIAAELPLANVQAYSIDDSSTTEIDDALSVHGLGSGLVTVGIHIAAPGLAFGPGHALDQLARARLSTVYMPGHKITMLPDEVVQTYTLGEGAPRPALSLYVTFDEATLEVQSHRSALEQVPIAHNLRHDQLDQGITADWLNLTDDLPAAELPGHVQALRPELAFLWRLAQTLKARREVVRGKPETFNRPDYAFKLLDKVGDEPLGEETVAISIRKRGAPLDLMVAEAMILANSTWGQWLAQLGVPAIYRSQASLAPGVKVRMGTKALPHAGIGVPSYAWSTSPLRRYTDLVNQWQIIACVQSGATAALVAPFKPKDAELFSVISGFDAAYSAYNQFQNGMERYWTLKHVQQQGITSLTATLIKDRMVRADTLPLVLPVMGADGLPRGAQVRVQLGEPDLITLDIAGTVTEVLGGQASQEAAEDGEDEDTVLPVVTVDIAMDSGPAVDAPPTA